jgi:hypothetical protein
MAAYIVRHIAIQRAAKRNSRSGAAERQTIIMLNVESSRTGLPRPQWSELDVNPTTVNQE